MLVSGISFISAHPVIRLLTMMQYGVLRILLAAVLGLVRVCGVLR